MFRSLTQTLPRTTASSALRSSPLAAATASQQPLFLILRRRMASSSVAFPSPIVSVQWLKDNYSRVRVVDGSAYMPNEKQDPWANYLKARLPNSVFFDLDACTSKEGKNAVLPHMMPSAAQFSEYMGQKLGLTADDSIVLYDGKGIFSAPRIRLTMQYYGARNVAILEGGFKAWVASGGQIESGPLKADAVKPVKFVVDQTAAGFEKGFIRDMATVKAESEKPKEARSFQLVDARSKGRFDGTEPEPRPELPSGHVEGAMSVPFTSLLDVDPSSGASRMKSPADLQKVFLAAGVDPATKETIVASCGSGVTACIVLLGLELAGRKKNTGLYDGSWTEWALDKSNKIVSNKK